jgi:hypothetical protein
MVDRETGRDEVVVIKLRGFTFDYLASEQITWNAMWDFVSTMDPDAPQVAVPLAVERMRITCNRHFDLYTIHESRDYRPVYTKGIVYPGYECLPFGYVTP